MGEGHGVLPPLPLLEKQMPSSMKLRDEIILDAARCCSIRCIANDYVQKRDLGPNSGWQIFYEYAKMHPEMYVCEYDAQLASEVKAETGSYRFTRQDLEGMSVPKLRKIGVSLGATGDGKVDLVENILKAQG